MLTQGELAITRDLTIDGDRNDDGDAVTIDGDAKSRILNITGGGTDVTLRDLTLANGRPGQMRTAALSCSAVGHLTLNRRTVSENVRAVQRLAAVAAGWRRHLARPGSRVDIAPGSTASRAPRHGGGIAAVTM